MASVLADVNLGRRLAATLACALLLLGAAMALSDGAAAAKKSRGCDNCTAKASKAGKGKKGKAKSGKRRHPAKVTAAAPGTAPSASAQPAASAPSSAATPAASATSPTAPRTQTVGGIPVEIGEAVKVEVGAGEPTSSGCGASASASVAAGMGTFSAVVRPTSCWRPYATDSPFNTPIAPGAGSAGSSTAQVSRLLAGGAINYLVAGDPSRDWGTAVYYPHSSDPTYTVHCLEQWGHCPLEGQQVHLPQGATPSGPWPIGGADADSHMTIVDQETGWEYDFWNVREIGNGRIVTKWGGMIQIEGSGLGSDAVAAQFGTLAGMIRPAEMRAGQIDHALALTIPCTQGIVAPATKGGLECDEAGMPTADALPMGAHLQLQMSTGEIEALNAPAWKKGILRAFATYGAYVEDTTGDSSQWGLKFESPNGSTSLGGPDEYVELAKSLGMEAQDYNGNGYPEYWFNIAGGVDWSKLRVVS